MEAHGKNRILVLIACLGFLVISSGSVSASSDWWDSNYQYRQQFTVTNNAGSVLEPGYTVDMPLDITGLVGAGKAKANGDDVRAVFLDGASFVEIDRLLDIGGGKVTFATQADVNPSGSDANYWVYYGNPGAVTAPDNTKNIFLFYEDFEDGTVGQAPVGWVGDTANWDISDVRATSGNKSLRAIPQGVGWKNIKKGFTENETGDILVEYDINTGTRQSGEDTYIAIFNSSLSNQKALLEMNSAGGLDCTQHFGTDFDAVSPYTCFYLYSANTWYNIRINVIMHPASETATYYVDGALQGSETGPLSWGDFSMLSLGQRHKNNDFWYDDIKVRKYLSPEPTIIRGGEEVTATIWEIVAALEEKIDILNATVQNQTTINQEQETQIGLIESTVNTLKDFVKNIYDALPGGWKTKMGPWPF